jgi:hypothetical protein
MVGDLEWSIVLAEPTSILVSGEDVVTSGRRRSCERAGHD